MGIYKKTALMLTAFLSVWALLLGNQAVARPIQQPKQSSEAVPMHILYRQLFKHIVLLDEAAQEADANDEDGDSFRNLYRNLAELTDTQSQALHQIAAECEQLVDRQDAKAKVIIERYQAQFVNGEVPYGQPLPPPPAELIELQEQRNMMILTARTRLRQALGEEAFQRFEAFVASRFASNTQSYSLR